MTEETQTQTNIVAVVVTDAEGKVIATDEVLRTRLGSGATVFNLLRTSDHQVLQDALAQAIANQRKTSAQLSIPGPGDKWTAGQADIVPIAVEGKALVLVVFSTPRPCTGSPAYQHKLSLLDAMTYEIRSLLQELVTTQEYVRSLAADNSELSEIVDGLLTEVGRAVRLANSVRTILKLESEPVEVRVMDLATTVERSFEMTSELYPDRNLGLVATFDEGQFKVMCSDLLVDALSALLSVSVEMCHPEESRIVVDAKMQDGDRVLLTISDNGERIPEENHEKIFDIICAGLSRSIGQGLNMAEEVLTRCDASVRLVEEPADEGLLLRFAITLSRAGSGTSSVVSR